MEVHHHGHSADPGLHRGKKWKHYFWEFFMLFLAVTAGFFVENIREHYVEDKRAKQFAVTLSNNLKADTTQLGSLLRFRAEKNRQKDSLLDVLSRPANPEYDSFLHRFIFQGFLFRRYFIATDAAWQEVKSTGALRYMHRKVVDSLVRYYTEISDLTRSEGMESTEIKDLTPTLYNYMNADYIYARRKNKPYTELKKIRKIKEDPDARNLLFNWGFHFLSVSEGMMMEYQKCLLQGTNLLQLLKKEYHLK